MADDDYYDVWLDMLGRTSRPRFRALILDRAGVALDVELAQYLVMIDVRGPIGVLELAELLDANHPKVSRSLARLEELGLVRRAAAEHDRRIKTAAVTPEGRRVVEQINQGRRRILDEAFVGWSDRDRAELARLTRRFANNIFALVDSLEDKPLSDRDVFRAIYQGRIILERTGVADSRINSPGGLRCSRGRQGAGPGTGPAVPRRWPETPG